MVNIALRNNALKDAAKRAIDAAGFDDEMVIRPYKSSRSAAQNRLYWRWLTEIAEQAKTSDGQKLSKEEWHHLCALHFIGVKSIESSGKSVVIPAKSTTKLNVSEFTEYLTQIEAEFLARGVSLTFTDDYGTAMGKD